MRIVMTTDDREIDRRILMEAETLIEQNHEVILLAKDCDLQPKHEIIGKIKVERLSDYEAISPLFRKLEENHFYDIEPLPSNKIDAYAGLPYNSLKEAFSAIFIDSTFDWAWRPVRKLIKGEIFVFFILKVVFNYLKEFYFKYLFFKKQSLPFYGIKNKFSQKINPYAGLPYNSLKEAYHLIATQQELKWIWRPGRVSIKGQLFISFMLKVGLSFIKGFFSKFRRGKNSLGCFVSNKNLVSLYPKKKLENLLTINKTNKFSYEDIPWSDLNSWDKILVSRILFYNPDVIHAHDLPQLESAVIAAKVLKCKIIYDAHEIYPQINTLTKAQTAYLTEKEKSLLPFLDSMITVNPFIAQWFSENYHIKAPTVIRNSVKILPNINYTLKTKKLHSILNLSSTTQVLLFQGWISLTRGIGDLIKSMEFVNKNIILVLIGYTSDAKKIQKLIRPFKDRIYILPKVPFEELHEYTNSADAGIIPYQINDLNHALCSPNKLFEFINVGLPIIGNKTAYLEQIIEGEKFGITETLDKPVSFANAINKMFDMTIGGPERFRRRILKRRDDYLWDPTDKNNLLKVYFELFSKENSH